MTPSSKAKVLTDAELEALRDTQDIGYRDRCRLFATIDALKAELALKDKVVEAARDALALLLPLAQAFEKQASQGKGGRRGGPVFTKARAALNDLDKVIAR